MSIFLTGLPSSGKSTFGIFLNKIIEKNSKDLDCLIEKIFYIEINNYIMIKKSEIFFRSFEKNLLNFAAFFYFFSTGGGYYLFYNNILLTINQKYIIKIFSTYFIKTRNIIKNSSFCKLYNERIFFVNFLKNNDFKNE
ncbi:shikimate kinase [Candidatus Vidania fulgoroideorum]